MNEHYSWSANAGRWGGIPVRVHLLLFLFIAIVFGIQSNFAGQSMFGTALVTSLCLVGCIVLHELAHVFALTNFGGLVNNIVLAPWGGNSDFSLPEHTQGKLMVHLAGPMFSGALFALGSLLLINFDYAELGQLTNPFNPIAFDIGEPQISTMKIATWINFQLMIVNLIPCYPFDGAGVIRVIVHRITSQATMIRRESTVLVIGQATGMTLIGCAWFLSGYEQSLVKPVWLLFLVAGITLIFAARYSYNQHLAVLEDSWDDTEEFDYDAIYGDSSFFDFPEDEHSDYSQWLLEKQEARDRSEREREEQEESFADEILKKLHRDGIESLTEEEKGILNRVSARLRRRRQQGV